MKKRCHALAAGLDARSHQGREPRSVSKSAAAASAITEAIAFMTCSTGANPGHRYSHRVCRRGGAKLARLAARAHPGTSRCDRVGHSGTRRAGIGLMDERTRLDAESRLERIAGQVASVQRSLRRIVTVAPVRCLGVCNRVGHFCAWRSSCALNDRIARSPAPKAKSSRGHRNTEARHGACSCCGSSIVEFSFHARSPQAECERLTNCQQSSAGNAPSSGKGLETQRSFA
jgi:hypothetical protein